jgi:DNA-binding transcriptional MerR regulator
LLQNYKIIFISYFLFLTFFVSLQQKERNMALNLNKNLKLYYSIKEVAQMFGVNESTLRFWEQEFPYLKPKTSGPAKIRQYQEKDIEQIRLIHNLVKVRGFKLAAAKKIINSNRDGAERKAEVLTRLIDIRSELQALKKQMDFLQ